MKTVLCYGDSNTWGSVPAETTRYDIHTRWPGVMRDLLGEGYWIIEEGLPGRTTSFDDPVEGAHKNGMTYLYPCLESHNPLDLVIIMLGTNNLKQRFSSSAYDIAQSAGLLVHTTNQGINGIKPKVLLVCPPPIGRLTHYAEMFAGADEKSQWLASHYARVADELKCTFFNAGDVIRSSDRDGIHLEAEAHSTLGGSLASVVRDILAD